MWMWRPPGVYRPQDDTWLMVEALADAGVPPGGRALDVCTGTGALAVAAARAGAREVTAVDRCRRAVLAARVNGAVRGIRVEARHGDFGDLVGEDPYDLITANPPYVPSTGVPDSGPERAWDAGRRGRAVLDRLCAVMPLLLADKGVGLIVHSTLCDSDTTLHQLRGGGLKASVVARRTIPFGPVMRGRARWLEEQGLIAPGQTEEELVVVRADAA
ncbi:MULTISPECIES: HemK2/MTQ2 family protein methyltransferase [Saccharothrix]|uniref:Methyltransferase n=1 Tax=Saccharothrix yanglingensis TaxID=659496 RepID=A0ABU0X7D2_9PSEU|nr:MULTISPECIES: HemK2/MTQ2 family protein methyltransferase [Saccharothrix]MDQ2588039.1 methyltransferase [Saccharothrix yanglingensis]MDU0287878.1 methyltransferase [Saccharothrix longispora]